MVQCDLAIYGAAGKGEITLTVFDGLDSDKQYVLSLNDKEVSMSGSELMYAGIPLDKNKEGKKYGDFSSLLFYIKEE